MCTVFFAYPVKNINKMIKLSKKKKKKKIIHQYSIRQTIKTRKHNILRAKKELEVKIQRSYAVPVEKD